MRRLITLLPVLIAFQAGVPPALAWTWPADGPVLQPFVFGDDPYASGQHRGIDVAGPAGGQVLAPAAGIVSFAGTVPGGGRSVTVETADGYSITLVHLGSSTVARDVTVGEGEAVGTIGPSGDAEQSAPYVHLGVRITEDAQGYVDPLTLLPERPVQPPVAPPPPPVSEPVGPAPKPRPSVPAIPAAPVSEPASKEPDPTPPTAESAESVDKPLVLARAIQPAEPFQAVQQRPPAAAHAAREVPSRAKGEEMGRRLGVPPRSATRTLARSFEPPLTASAGARPTERQRPTPVKGRPSRSPKRALVVRAGAALALIVALLVAVRRQLAETRPAEPASSVVDHRASRAAEDAVTLRPSQEDRLVLDGDLERVALGQPESLPNLDRDDDPAQLVEMPNDSCRRIRPAASSRSFHRVGHGPSSRCRSAELALRR
jgi:Peptidase family M23